MAPHFKRVPGPQKAYFNYEVTLWPPPVEVEVEQGFNIAPNTL